MRVKTGSGDLKWPTDGTLFLDEIEIFPRTSRQNFECSAKQADIENSSNEITPIDIRLICATNVSLAELGNEKQV